MAFKEIPKPVEAAEDVTTLRIRIEGTVQGVGFRAFVLKEANARRLVGWVRNRMDGSLEALASGPTKQIESLITCCMKGPRGARVANIDLFVADAPKEPGFTMRPTL
jgi:acylphosphatase